MKLKEAKRRRVVKDMTLSPAAVRQLVGDNAAEMIDEALSDPQYCRSIRVVPEQAVEPLVAELEQRGVVAKVMRAGRKIRVVAIADDLEVEETESGWTPVGNRPRGGGDAG